MAVIIEDKKIDLTIDRQKRGGMFLGKKVRILDIPAGKKMNFDKFFDFFVDPSQGEDLILRPREDGAKGIQIGDNTNTLRPLYHYIYAVDDIILSAGQISFFGNLLLRFSMLAGETLAVQDVVRLGNVNQTNDLRAVSQSSSNTTTTLISDDTKPSHTSAIRLAQKLSFGSNSERLKEIDLTINALANSNGNTWTAHVKIHTDSSDSPGSVVGTSDSVEIHGGGTKTFTFSTPVTLSADTTYWATIGWDGADADNWGDQAGDSATLNTWGSTTGIFTGMETSTDNGSTWRSVTGNSFTITLRYVDTVNRLYKTKATNAELVDGLVGIIVTAAAQGSNAGIVLFGNCGAVFSGLTAGQIYYVSDTRGVLGTSAGTVKRILGIATVTNNLFIQVK